MKKGLIIIGAILGICLVAAASFWGGMKYQENQADQVVARFENARGPLPGAESPEGGIFAQGGDQQTLQSPGFIGRGGGVNGQIKSIDGNTLAISTAEDVTMVNLSDDTRIQQTLSVPFSELQPGMRVMVIGENDDDGNVDAVQIMILDVDFQVPGDQNLPEKAP
jgi:hypothetical protein